MAVQGRPPVTLMSWFEVPWVCGTVAGIRHIRAPDGRSAEYDLEHHGADYGLPSEEVIVGRAKPLRVKLLELPFL